MVNEEALNKRPLFKPQGGPNLTKGEREAILQLKQNVELVIKPADKGSAVVLLDLEDYLAEGYKQLSDTNTYRKLETCPTEEYRGEVQSFIYSMYQKGEIDQSTYIYLTDEECRTPNLYLVPKIHKNKNPPPGRPVVSANGCPTEKIS